MIRKDDSRILVALPTGWPSATSSAHQPAGVTRSATGTSSIRTAGADAWTGPAPAVCGTAA